MKETLKTEDPMVRNETVVELKRIRELLELEAEIRQTERRRQEFNEIYGGFFGQSIGE